MCSGLCLVVSGFTNVDMTEQGQQEANISRKEV